MMRLILFVLSLIFTTINISGQYKVNFILSEVPEDSILNVGIRGSVAPLNWEKSIPLKKMNGLYSISLEFQDVSEDVEFKFVRYRNDRDPIWEGIQNRTISLGANADHISNNIWNQEQLVDISKLEPLAPEQLLEDFELIKTMVLDVHPGTYRYNNKKQITEALEELKSSFSQSLTTGDAYLAISKLTAQLKCDHTKAGFNNQNKVINSIIHYQKDKLPFTFRWIGNEMIVTRNASNNQLLKRGVRITRINSIPVEEIKEKMILYVGADGATDANRSYKLEVNGYDFRYNAFDIFFPLLYPLNGNNVALEIEDDETGKVMNVEVSALSRDERTQILMERYSDFPQSRDDLWKFEVLGDSIGLLTMNSFGLFGWKAMTLDYKDFLFKTFAELRSQGINHLVIDIRENTGGADEMSNELFTYLSNEPYQLKREGRTRYINFPESLKPYVQTWGDNPWYFNLEPKNNNPIGGYYIFEEAKNKSEPIKHELYKGQVYLLVSSANTSLAFYTAQRFKQQQIGPTIGQETGGNLNDINGGQILFLRLPNSQIEIDFPVMGGFSIDPQPNTGVIPDVEVMVRREDILENRDAEIETVLKIIKDGSRR
ncbi:S41 family peptidase [Namhaeicola litoreus]|uniref:S41 family peptidase n=1 Tax=Namhaeicola litoreus TaxID=1052145 RepID=A0ABW3Y3J4_9FLAO